jgi:ribonuclease D
VYLHDTTELRALVDRARPHGRIAIDTEFMREKTYWARLCLIQLAVGDECAILDPLQISDLGPLLEVLEDESVLKVLHAGSQDLEIFYRLAGRAASPVFDTQIAATLAGFPSQVGYARLVKDLFDVDIDKSDTFTDWARRPLTPAQFEYALNDVRYLDAAYLELTARLEHDGRTAWLAGDLAALSDPEQYEIHPEEQYRRIKRAASLSRRQLGVLQQVTAWREREAMRRDLPRRWVMSDETLTEVARRRPADTTALADIRGFNLRSVGGDGAGLLEAVRRGVDMPDAQLPRIERRPRAVVDIEGVVELMGALLRLRASEHGIAVPLLATRAELERLASGERDGSPLLSGWRRAIVGEDLVQLVEGRLALSVADGKIMVEKVGDSGAVEPSTEGAEQDAETRKARRPRRK